MCFSRSPPLEVLIAQENPAQLFHFGGGPARLVCIIDFISPGWKEFFIIISNFPQDIIYLT